MEGSAGGQGEGGGDMLVRKAAPSVVSLTLEDDPAFACRCDMVQQRSSTNRLDSNTPSTQRTLGTCRTYPYRARI